MPRHVLESFSGDPVRGDADGLVNGLDLRADIGGDDEGLTAEALAQCFERANDTEIECVGRSEVIDDASDVVEGARQIGAHASEDRTSAVLIRSDEVDGDV